MQYLVFKSIQLLLSLKLQIGKLKAIMISDDVALRMLDETTFNKLGPAGQPEEIDTQAIIDTDARPDKIKFLDPPSLDYSRALVKLKAAVKLQRGGRHLK